MPVPRCWGKIRLFYLPDKAVWLIAALVLPSSITWEVTLFEDLVRSTAKKLSISLPIHEKFMYMYKTPYTHTYTLTYTHSFHKHVYIHTYMRGHVCAYVCIHAHTVVFLSSVRIFKFVFTVIIGHQVPNQLFQQY